MMKSMKDRYPILFFDLDGTMTDSAPGILNGVRYAFQKMGNDSVVDIRYVGPPLLTSFQEYAHMSKKEAEQAVYFYREYYNAENGGWKENRVYEGVPQMLEALKNAGFRMAVATGKPIFPAKPILELFDLAKYFEYVSAANDTNLFTKAQVIDHAMQMVGASAERVLMIGDRHHDVEGGEACGVDVLGVLYGYGTKEELSKAKYIAKTPLEILEILEV